MTLITELKYNNRGVPREKKIMQACFIGHRHLEPTEKLESSLLDTVIMLIKMGVTTFMFGSKSDFDHLSWSIVTKLKAVYPHIKRVYVRSSFRYINKFYEDYLLEYYDSTYFPSKIENAGKYSYVERNFEMIDNSTYCIFYYNDLYSPSPKSNDGILRKRSSGTKIAYEYALKKGKKIINLYQLG